ncbi:MAG: O-methyltransferase [Chloroflexi bacterium]|nr:O-methyltransferase [Chloroflexota bacterium]
MKGTPITERLYDYIVANFAQEDDLLRNMPAEAERRGVPLIHISPEQGKFLQVLMKAAGARKVLEIGALFGYSTIWLARALPEDGRLIALEVHPLHAQVTRENVARAGLAHKVEVREGNALDLLAQLDGEGPFDLAFIDADKPGYVSYLEHALRLVRPGGLIVGDNASAQGNVWKVDADSDAEFINAIRAFNERMATDPRLVSVLVPIADGMCVGVVNGG